MAIYFILPPLSKSHMNIPTKIKLIKNKTQLYIKYNKKEYLLSAEFLRINSPSAEVTGHGKPILQYGKINVKIINLTSIGNYAIKINFDDGHHTGIYSWEYLYNLASNHEKIWSDYLLTIKKEKLSRDPSSQVIKFIN